MSQQIRDGLLVGLLCGVLFVMVLVGLQATFLLSQAAEVLGTVTMAAQANSERLGAVLGQAHDTLASLEGASEQARASLVILADEADKVQVAFDSHAHELTHFADERLGETNRILAVLVNNTSQSEALLTGSVENMAQGIQTVEKQVLTVWPEFFDCAGLGPSCLQNRIFNTTAAVQRTMEATERTMRAVEAVAPRMADSATRNSENVAGITEDVHTFTSRFMAARTKKQKVWDGLKSLAYILARAF